MNGVVIIGAGLAGSRCAEALRAGGAELPITLIGAEPVGPYERPALSKEFLAGTRLAGRPLPPPPGLLGGARDRPQARLARRARRCQAAHRAPRRPGARLEPSRGGNGSARPTPSRRRLPERPPPANARRREALRAALRPGARLVVIGAGFVGAEVASTATGLGVDVTIDRGRDGAARPGRRRGGRPPPCRPLARRRSLTPPGRADRARRPEPDRAGRRDGNPVRRAARGGRGRACIRPPRRRRRNHHRRMRTYGARRRVRLRRRGKVRRPAPGALDERFGSGSGRRLRDPRQPRATREHSLLLVGSVRSPTADGRNDDRLEQRRARRRSDVVQGPLHRPGRKARRRPARQSSRRGRIGAARARTGGVACAHGLAQSVSRRPARRRGRRRRHRAQLHAAAPDAGRPDPVGKLSPRAVFSGRDDHHDGARRDDDRRAAKPSHGDEEGRRQRRLRSGGTGPAPTNRRPGTRRSRRRRGRHGCRRRRRGSRRARSRPAAAPSRRGR